MKAMFYNKYLVLKKCVYLMVVIMCCNACSDLVEVDLPNTYIGRDLVFEDPTLVDAVLRSIYSNTRDQGFTNSATLSILMGLYTDDLDLYLGTTNAFNTYYIHQVLSDSGPLADAWSSAYSNIYECNAAIEGINASTGLSVEEKNQFKGEALFLRGYIHLVLVQVFGDVPYIDTSNYLVNAEVSRMPTAEVYQKIIADLEEAAQLLPAEDFSQGGERIRAYQAAAQAALARAYLYAEDWDMAQEAADDVIEQFNGLEPDLDEVFLKGSQETIWQFKAGDNGENTDEAREYILTVPPIYFLSYALTDDFYNAFEANDLRKDHWVGDRPNFTGPEVWHYAFKYKERNNTSTSVEYPIQLRLAEQYLIRAEAYAQQNMIAEAQADLNTVRNRAGLSNTTANTQSTLLTAILQERRVELFTEHGHRWFDLNRMGQAQQVLEPIKSGWRDTDVLFPIPISEIFLNPNLSQNDGY